MRMSTLSKYILRAHVGPFLFAFTALTGLLFLNAIAQRLESLVGKGLSWDVLVEFVILSLPHTVALTLPMSILVAVLYTFSDLTANNEITAMAAGGVKPTRILFPLIVTGILFMLGMLYFNDRILPEANHRLKTLLVDIGNKSPTFELREQVVNQISADDGGTRYYLRTGRIDRQTNDLYDVVIYDVSSGAAHRTTYADSGSMAFNAAGTDLYLTLHDGVVVETDEDDPGELRHVEFERQVVPLRGVGDVLQRRTGGGQRGDREMSIAMLAQTARDREDERASLRREVREESQRAVREALGLQLMDPFREDAGATPGEGEADGSGAGSESEGGAPPERVPPEEGPGPAEEAGSEGETAVPGAAKTVAQDGGALTDALTRRVAGQIRSNAMRAESLALQAARYRVEIHKKFTIAFACLVFVLVGAPIAVRFPRGGVGMTIAVSVGIFGIYWMGLIGGEKLADAGVVHPFVSMWTPNLVFLVVGVLMTMRMERWVATSRGGGWADLWHTLKTLVRVPARLVHGEKADAGAGAA